jgi:hypothetical protein
LNSRGFAGILTLVGSSLTFYRLLVYLAAGGLAAVALVPQKQVSRGFFRFSALLYAALIAAGLAVVPGLREAYAAGELRSLVSEMVHRPSVFSVAAALFLAAGLLAALAAALATPLGTAWSRRALALAGLAGLVGVGLSGFRGATAFQQWLSTAAALVSALLLGSVLSAMILGHWYLVMPKLPPDPLMRLARLFGISVVLRIAAVAGVIGVTYFAGGRSFDRFVDEAGILLWPRLLFGLAGPFVLAAMTLPTVKVRDTQPATGMLYVACVLVLVGEGIAQYLCAVTGVPV